MTDQTFNRFFSYGTNAQRLAFTPSPPTPASGPSQAYFWYETDTGDAYAYSTAWHKISSAGAAEVLLATSSPSGTGVVTFSGISAAYADLRVVLRGASTAAVTNSIVQLTLNNDSAGNYDWEQNQGSGNAGTPGTSGATNASFVRVGFVPGASGVANDMSSLDIMIHGYSQTTFHKNIDVLTSVVKTGGSDVTKQFLNIAGGWWHSTAAVNRVDLTLASPNYVAGTLVSLYGRTG